MYRLDVLCFEPPFRFSKRAMKTFTEADGAFSLVLDRTPGNSAPPSTPLAGFIVVQLATARRAQPEAYVVTLDVDPAFRRQGLARHLMLAAESEARARGARRLSLHVSTGNDAAIQFYAALGYTRLQLHPDFYAKGFAAWGYEKDLTGYLEDVIQSA